MKLAVSSIAWTNEEEPQVAELLQTKGVKYVEIAPTKLWQNPTVATDAETKTCTEFWKSYGIETVAFQSMLFTRPDLKLFESEENRTVTLSYLQDFIGLAGRMGVKRMVFGSPKNRQRGEMPIEDANQIAKDFFTAIGRTANENDVEFCIEPNAPQYACDFVTNAREGIDLVNAVDTPGFGLHLDIACMSLAGDNITESITAAAPVLKHFHVSSPMLEQVEARDDVDHVAAAAALRSIGYEEYVSIEMRPGEVGENVARVERAVDFAQSIYSS